MKNRNLLYFGICILLSTLMSCDVINPEEELPSYLHIENFDVAENPLVEEGSLKSKIVSAQILVNDISLGIIPIPSTIAVLAEGEAVVKVDPLVPENGNSDLLALYPFYNRTEINTSFSIGETTTISPTTNYDATPTIVGSDFNTANTFFIEDLDGNSETSIEIVETEGQAGEGSIGKIVLTEENATFTARTNSNSLFDVRDTDGSFSRVWLEIQYKTDVPLLFGLVDRTNGDDIEYEEFIVNAKDEWNIIYFNVENMIRNQAIEKFQLSLRAFYDNASEADEAVILLDNIKLIYF